MEHTIFVPQSLVTIPNRKMELAGKDAFYTGHFTALYPLDQITRPHRSAGATSTTALAWASVTNRLVVSFT